ncbi:HD-GYP domain-containing protein [Spirochaeta cellobiosiphila]|uniref:HD-GYP domain-containing protein n=1 Tax=Spirochaeta cellobiosiphila TaxID=504483 RepID=UPI000401C465|nr:HD-GYP domain-containing protein [Spirochaeta cellobiosiphila]
MKSISTNTIKPNTYYDSDIYLDDKYILLTPETPVTEELIKRLSKWKYTEIVTEGSTSGKMTIPGMDGIGQFDSDIKEKEALKEVNELFDKSLDYTEKLFDDFLRKSDLAIAPATDMVKEIIAMVKKNKKYILRLAELGSTDYDFLIIQSVKTCVLAIVIGEDMRMPAHKLIELGIAGLLHKIGMFRLPPALRNQTNPLSAEEKKALTAYPIIGYRVLKEFSLPANITLAILEHQERMDGTGYPQGLSGDRISMNARIIAIASNYSAQISSRPYREARNGHTSIVELLKGSGRIYDEQILKRLVFIISIYPLGSYVILNSGSIAQIVDTNTQEPRFPMLKLLTDEHGASLPEPRVLKTSEDSELQISRVLDMSEVSKLRDRGILPS